MPFGHNFFSARDWEVANICPSRSCPFWAVQRQNKRYVKRSGDILKKIKLKKAASYEKNLISREMIYPT